MHQSMDLNNAKEVCQDRGELASGNVMAYSRYDVCSSEKTLWLQQTFFLHFKYNNIYVEYERWPAIISYNHTWI